MFANEFPRNGWSSWDGEILETAKDDKEWHLMVCHRDHFICQVCGMPFGAGMYFEEGKNQFVCGHHLKRKGAHPELRLTVSNGKTVCLPCHNKIHSGKITLE